MNKIDRVTIHQNVEIGVTFYRHDFESDEEWEDWIQCNVKIDPFNILFDPNNLEDNPQNYLNPDKTTHVTYFDKNDKIINNPKFIL